MAPIPRLLCFCLVWLIADVAFPCGTSRIDVHLCDMLLTGCAPFQSGRPQVNETLDYVVQLTGQDLPLNFCTGISLCPSY
jgi:hypothetical protein